MTDERSIAAMVDALDGAGADAVAAMLPEGDGASALVSELAEEAERRIMADLDRAIRTTGALVSLAERRAAPIVRARVRRVHAQALTYANRYEEAMAALGEAIPEAEGAGDALEVGRIRLTMLHVFARQARHEEAVRCGILARDAFEAAGARELIGRAENNLGILERMRDRPGLAIAHFERAARELGGAPLLLAHVENNRAEALLDLDQFSDAEGAFRTAMAAFREAKAHRHAGIVLGNLADLASRQGRLHEALAMFEEARRALDLAEAPGDAARLAVEHADALQSLGLLAQAIAAYEAAIPVLSQHRMAAELARAHLGLGRSMGRLGRPGARDELARAEALYAELRNPSGRARALALTADAACAAGEFPAAFTLFGDARAAIADRPAVLAWVDLLQAGAMLKAGDPGRAGETAGGAIKVAESLGISPLAADLLQTRGRALLASGRPVEAAGELRRAVRHAERCRGTLQSDRFRAGFLGERASIWEDCTTAVLDAAEAGAVDEAFALVEHAKGRSLLEILGGEGGCVGREPDAAGDAGLLAELKTLAGELGALYARAHEGSDATAEARARTLREIGRRESAAEAIVIRLGAAANFAGSFATPTTLPELRAGIPDHGLVLEYFAEGGRLSAFVVTRRDVGVRRGIASLADVSARLDGLMFQIGRALARGLPGGDRGRRLAADADAELAGLSELLLSPFAAELRGVSALAIAPTAPLHGAPFPALPLWGGRALDRLEIGVTPNASILGRFPAARPGPALVAGVSDALAPRAEAEAHDVAAHLPGAVVLTGPAATRREVSRLCAGRSHVHFAGHARFIASNPAASGVLLADGWLTAADMARLDLRGASLMLSGCDTGRLAVHGGDEPMGLARAALSAGARSVTTTLWPVHDGLTSALMADAYRRMYAAGTAGSTIGPSLRAAQREMLNHRHHPAAWAPFLTVCAPW